MPQKNRRNSKHGASIFRGEDRLKNMGKIESPAWFAFAERLKLLFVRRITKEPLYRKKEKHGVGPRLHV